VHCSTRNETRASRRDGRNEMRCFRHFNLHEAEGTASAVYSLDLSPGGDTLATCGGDSLVRLWSCGVVFAGGGNDAPEAVPEAALAATLAKHTAVVTSVRWSGAGHRLASGSDDTFVFVWEPRAGGAWARAATLRGHGADVLDVAWSADDAMLASCSIDNSVCVWDARNLALLMAPLRTLRGHANWVKGVAWDPTGRFLASASEDRRVLVWRASGAVWKSNIRPDFNVRVFQHFDTSASALLRELDESDRFVQKSAESTSIWPR
jgi:WD40 repeat protein